MTLLVFGAASSVAGPEVHTGDADSDGVLDREDNCSEDPNPTQIDTDADNCGNICDMDYDNSGITGIGDFTAFVIAFNTGDLEKDHSEPVTGPVGIADFTAFVIAFNTVPGPSGMTLGSTACP